MELGETLLLGITTALMAVAVLLAFIPILPGPVLPWAVAIAFGALDGWQRFTPAAGAAATLLMLVGVTSDFWLPLAGVKTGGLTCMASIGSLIGGFIGTFVIPIPILGTLIGCVAGALVAELVRARRTRQALQAGRTAFKMFVLGYAIEATTSVGVAVVYVVSIVTMG